MITKDTFENYIDNLHLGVLDRQAIKQYIYELQDKLHRRNMQIRELKKNYNRVINSLSTEQLNKIFNR